MAKTMIIETEKSIENSAKEAREIIKEILRQNGLILKALTEARIFIPIDSTLDPEMFK